MAAKLIQMEFPPFEPRRGLRNPHLQTLAGNFLPRRNLLPPPEERLVQIEDDAQILCHCHWQPERAHALTLVIVHGLEGSSSSQYVIGTGSKAWAKGLNVIRMNMRNCGGTDRLAKSLYHSGLSNDVNSVVNYFIQSDGLKSIALVGFSMGGNLVLKLAGELGKDPPTELRAVAAVSPAMDLALSADALHERQNIIYEARFLFGLQSRFKRKAKLFPWIYDLPPTLRNMKTIRDFDHQITARYSGFASADDYYERASSSSALQNICVPTLIIHSADDPFIRISPATRIKLETTPSIKFIETEYGGHCAFLADAINYDGRWAERVAVKFCQNAAQQLMNF